MLILQIYSKLKLGSGQPYFLVLPFSAKMFEIGPKGTYNPFFFRLHNHSIITIIIIHKYPHKAEKFCILESP